MDHVLWLNVQKCPHREYARELDLAYLTKIDDDQFCFH